MMLEIEFFHWHYISLQRKKNPNNCDNLQIESATTVIKLFVFDLTFSMIY